MVRTLRNLGRPHGSNIDRDRRPSTRSRATTLLILIQWSRASPHDIRREEMSSAALCSTQRVDLSLRTSEALVVYTIQFRDDHSLVSSRVNQAYRAIPPTRRSFSTLPLPRPRTSFRPTPFRSQSTSPPEAKLSACCVNKKHAAVGIILRGTIDLE
jgi:hypothetical protein